MIAKTRNNRIVDPYLNRLLSQYPKTLQYLVIIFYITKCLFTRINSHLTDLFYRVACFRIPAAVASRHLLDTIISMGNSSEINEDKLNNAKRYMHILQEKNRCFSGATAANINLCIQRIKETNHWTLNEISAQLISISTYNEPNTHKGAIMSVLYSRSAVGGRVMPREGGSHAITSAGAGGVAENRQCEMSEIERNNFFTSLKELSLQLIQLNRVVCRGEPCSHEQHRELHENTLVLYNRAIELAAVEGLKVQEYSIMSCAAYALRCESKQQSRWLEKKLWGGSTRSL